MSRYQEVLDILERRVKLLELEESFCAEASYLRTCLDYCQSPIEELLVIGLFGTDAVLGHDFLVHTGARRGPYLPDILLSTYVKLGPHIEELELAIEVDGREWHDRSFDQVQRDRLRDRQMLRDHGISTLRFTGREIYRDPFAAAEEAVITFERHERRIRNIGLQLPMGP
jgi:hypothetical protein